MGRRTVLGGRVLRKKTSELTWIDFSYKTWMKTLNRFCYAAQQLYLACRRLAMRAAIE